MMILDKLLLNQLPLIGQKIKQFQNTSHFPKNIFELKDFFRAMSAYINGNNFFASLLSSILFNYVSSIEVRDRQATSRIFENILAGIFNTTPTDLETRVNPKVTSEIILFDEFCKGENWTISGDLSSNKREKTDLQFDELHLSIKTLKGKAYDQNGLLMQSPIIVNGESINNTQNNELNVGSFSFRALLKGILSNEKLNSLSDRLGGLGSGPELRKNVFDFITNKQVFYQRLKIFLNYVYQDDILIVFKSHYKLISYLIPNSSFIGCLLNTYQHDEKHFQDLWYRWENNNLRLKLPTLLNNMTSYKLPFYEVTLNVNHFPDNEELIRFNREINDYIQKYLSSITKND